MFDAVFMALYPPSNWLELGCRQNLYTKLNNLGFSFFTKNAFFLVNGLKHQHLFYDNVSSEHLFNNIKYLSN